MLYGSSSPQKYNSVILHLRPNQTSQKNVSFKECFDYLPTYTSRSTQLMIWTQSALSTDEFSINTVKQAPLQ